MSGQAWNPAYTYGLAFLVVAVGIAAAALIPTTVTYGLWPPRTLFSINRLRHVYIHHFYVLRTLVVATALIGAALLVAHARRHHLTTLPN